MRNWKVQFFKFINLKHLTMAKVIRRVITVPTRIIITRTVRVTTRITRR